MQEKIKVNITRVLSLTASLVLIWALWGLYLFLSKDWAIGEIGDFYGGGIGALTLLIVVYTVWEQYQHSRKLEQDLFEASLFRTFEALKPEFQVYIKNVLSNAKMLAETLKNNGFKIYSGGTDTHLMLVDLRPFNVKGNVASESLCRANITCNKNGIPFDTEKPMITSGIRLGSQAATTRGFGLKEFEKVGNLITKVIKGLSNNPEDNSKVEEEVRNEVISLCSNFPIYKNLNK